MSAKSSMRTVGPTQTILPDRQARPARPRSVTLGRMAERGSICRALRSIAHRRGAKSEARRSPRERITKTKRARRRTWRPPERPVLARQYIRRRRQCQRARCVSASSGFLAGAALLKIIAYPLLLPDVVVDRLPRYHAVSAQDIVRWRPSLLRRLSRSRRRHCNTDEAKLSLMVSSRTLRAPVAHADTHPSGCSSPHGTSA